MISNKLLILPNYFHPYDPPVKPSWWKEDHYCNYHRSNGASTNNFYGLKDAIEDLIDGGIYLTNGLVKNYDHKAFKTPLIEYEKLESSQVQKKNHDAKINYNYANNENVINMLEPVESIFMMRPKENVDTNYDIYA